MRLDMIKAVRALAGLLVIGIGACCGPRHHAETEPIDEARASGKTVADFPETGADVFAKMDVGMALNPDEMKGRNTWLMWTGGNEAFWDHLARHGYGLADLLRTLDSRRRGSRFKELGLINEPGFRQATHPDANGLWLDERIVPEPQGVNPHVDGRSSGIVGLRLFPNPAFAAARGKWDAERYDKDPEYQSSPELVRPYRVGMSCAFCHVAFHPLHPPADPENPDWSNLSSNIGNQYWRTNGVFGGGPKAHGSFVYELLASAKPGTVDTSLLASDGNNNPTAINPLFQVGARLARARQNRPDQIGSHGALLEPGGELRHVPHVLIDGADSIGVIGAVMRVYVSIGAFHEQWLRDHSLLVGLRPQKPFDIAAARRNSVYWQATERRAQNVAKFLVKVSRRVPLAKAPGGADRIKHDEAILTRGKLVFADHCIACHSSKQPAGGETLDPAQWREWMQTEEYLRWARTEVLKPDFLEDNYLSTDQRHPVTLIKTHAGRALADNATRGHVWNDFSSETYKELPSVGAIDVLNPFDGTTWQFQVPAGGPGYYRVPSLVGVWATAPLLHNNSLGEFSGDPSVAGRLRAFDDAIEKLLWPEKRAGEKSILRTGEKTWLRIPAAAMVARGTTLGTHGGDLSVGPIPKGTPIDLLANLNPSETDPAELWKLGLKIQRILIESASMSDDDARRYLREQLGADLLRLSKSPDFIEDRGHLFGTGLPDEDKKALIEFLKTM